MAANDPDDLYFPPVHNGMDYLASVIENLDGTPTPRRMKYALMHLQAATETLLKALLNQIDWRLVFSDPAKAERGKYERGDFHSCYVADAVTRLRKHGVEIPADAQAAINVMGQQRNKLQHFGFVAPSKAVESRAAQVLDFLLGFVADHLRPELTGVEADHVDQEMESLREALGRVRSLVDTRMNRLKAELSDVAASTLLCPMCGQWAMVVEDGAECWFCHKKWDADDAAQDYSFAMSGMSWREVREMHIVLSGLCLSCEAETMVGGVAFADAPDDMFSFCFTCLDAYRLSSMETCSRCGVSFPCKDDDIAVCPLCWEDMMASE